MAIKFRYIDYGSNFIKEFWHHNDKSDKNLYIFTDNRMKDIFIKKMLMNPFMKAPTFVTFGEFKEKVFITDKVVLKEAKRILAFFKSIPDDIKKELEIKTYYDVIDLANNFFLYYKELNLSLRENIKTCPVWQEKNNYYFKKIKDSFDKLLQEYNYVPNDWLEDKKYFSKEWLSQFKKIIFIDIIEFPKLYVDIIQNLAEEIEIEITLQINNKDFDEKQLRLKTVSIPEKVKDIKVFKYNKYEEEIFSLVQFLEKDHGEVYSANSNRDDLHILLPKYFGRSQNFTMNDTKLYKFLNIQLDILRNTEERLGRVYPISSFLDAFENKIFQEYYSLKENDFSILNKIAFDGYIYISSTIIKESFFVNNIPAEFLDKINNIFYDLDSILEIQTSDDLYKFFKKNINFNKFIENDFDNEDLFDKFFEIFGTLKSNENMKIHKNFNEYFGDKIGESFYRLLIQYMKDLVIKGNIENSKNITIVKPLDTVKYNEENITKTNYFIDINDNCLPKNITDTLIFTDKQRKELGSFTKEERREIERYRFFQAIFSNKNSVIFTQKNIEENIDISPFLEEIIIKYNIEVENSPINSNNIPIILKQGFQSSKIFELESTDNIFSKFSTDFINKSLYLGAYDFSTLVSCPLKFYFSKIASLEHIEKKEEIDIDIRVFGTIVHKIIEIIVNSVWKDFLKNGISPLDKNYVEKIVKETFYSERAKIPVHMDNYYKEILIPLFTRNITYFFEELSSAYRNIKITRFQSEKSSFENRPFYSNDINIYLKGRADLVIESENGNEIIDYKTGNKTKNQLDYYSIILYGNENTAKKAIFNAWLGKIEEEKEITLTRENLQEIISNFISQDKYERVVKKSDCNRCMYSNICKKELDDAKKINIES